VSIRRTETRRFRVDNTHDECECEAPGVWIFDHTVQNVLIDDMTLHKHHCSACGEVQQFYEKWPKIEYGDTGDTLTASEALYGFCGWLTSREELTRMSSKDDASAVVELISEFCKTNKLSQPRDNWDAALKQPKDKK